MTNQREKILEAAVHVFMRYGVGRTRMGDIATEAGVVRQTLYSFFNSKDDVLCAAIRYFADKSFVDIQAAWEKSDKLEDMLDAFFEHSIISSFAIISASSDARDMIGGYSEAGKAETVRAQNKKIKAWTDLLSTHSSMQGGKDITPKKMAEYIVLSSLGLRDQAADKRQLKQLLATMKSGILSQLI